MIIFNNSKLLNRCKWRLMACNTFKDENTILDIDEIQLYDLNLGSLRN